MRNFIQIIETLFRDPQLAKTQFNIYTTAQDHPAVKELLKRKGITAHETPAKSKIGKITLTIEGTNLLYDELDRALKMAALSGTNLSVFRAPRAGDGINESDAKPWDSLAGMKDGAVCTCSDAQLANVGCDCDAHQNLPVNCENCGAFLRTPEDIEAEHCKSCK